MAQNGKLRLDLVDVYGKRLQENVDIALRNLQLTHFTGEPTHPYNIHEILMAHPHLDA